MNKFKVTKNDCVVLSENTQDTIHDTARKTTTHTPTQYKLESWSLGHKVNEDSLSIEELRNKYNLTGKGIKVAILDSGIRKTHELFKDKKITGINFTSKRVFNKRVGRRITYKTIRNPKDFGDDLGHGTHCAGVICGNVLDEQHRKINVSVAPDCELYIAKVIDKTSSGSIDYVIKGIEWAIQNEVDIISISLGYNGTLTHDLKKAINDAIQKNIIVVCAAGNDGPKNNTVNAPGTETNLITIGATNKKNKIAAFSSRGTQIDIVAPGVDIPSGYYRNDKSYALMSGTSMAVPFVVGCAALFLEYVRREKYDIHEDEIRISNFFEKFCKETSVDLGVEGFDTSYGYGYINMLLDSIVHEDEVENEDEIVNIDPTPEENLIEDSTPTIGETPNTEEPTPELELFEE